METIQLSKKDLQSIITQAVESAIAALEKRHFIVDEKPKEKSAYAKTESLLYNYRGFQRVVEARMKEIEEIKQYGVPQKSKSIVEWGGSAGGTVQGLSTSDETVESAVRKIMASVEDTVHVISMIDRYMGELRKDPYYDILEMRYFEGRTQEDIALTMGCSQVTISNNKSRLVKELAMRIFPDQAIRECMQ